MPATANGRISITMGALLEFSYCNEASSLPAKLSLIILDLSYIKRVPIESKVISEEGLNLVSALALFGVKVHTVDTGT
jgi:hypothetical protein